MGEGEEVRVVRCPKCRKLLPELVGVKVFRCGGCNAALQANKSKAVMMMETSMEKSKDDKVNVSAIHHRSPSCTNEASSSACKETNSGSHVEEFGENEGAFPGKDSVFSGSPASATDSSDCRDVCNNHSPSQNKFSGSASHNLYGIQNSADNCLNVDEHSGPEDCKSGKMQEVGACAGKKVNNVKHEGASGPQRFTADTSRGIRFSPYPDEGPSHYRQRSAFSHPELKYQNTDLPNRVELLEQDRAELLRKLDELRDQLSRTCEVTNKQTERVHMDGRAGLTNLYEQNGLNGWAHDDPSSTEAGTVPTNPYSLNGFDGRSYEGPPSVNGPPRPPFPVLNGHDADLQHYHSALHSQDDILGYGEPFPPYPPRRTPCQTTRHYPERPSNGCLHGRCDPGTVTSYPHDDFRHQAICSHPDPHTRHFHGQVPLNGFTRGSYLSNYELSPTDDPTTFGARDFSSRNTVPFLYRHPSSYQRPTFKPQNGHWYHPLGGGAPYVVCSHCFQLMEVPHRLIMRGEDRHKVRCSSCSEIISFEVRGNRLVVSPAPKMDTSSGPKTNTFDENREGRQQGVHRNGAFGSDYEDYDNPMHNFHSMDEKFILSPPFLDAANHVVVGKAIGTSTSPSKHAELMPSCYDELKDGRFSDPAIYQSDMARYADLPQKFDVNSRAPSVPLREHFGCSSFNHGGSRSETGSRSARSEQDKVCPANGNFKQNSVKDVLLATEMDFPADEYPNPDLSQDSTEACEEDHPRTSKGGDSFLAGLIKKGFKDFSRSTQSQENGKYKVAVNGHRIPDRVVKKAEKRAGPVQPGEYWYDYRAGFWGVMGQPCLGIIPSFIEEFNFPMPRSCAGGDTGVIVNGRELHQKDLDLLASRGLPTTRDNSYIIEISGRVLDAVTGEELDCLGKLAPTVEKAKHGFGMRVSGIAAA